MAEFKVPELGENVTSGDVTRVLVNVGDTIAQEQPVLELETEKATIEVPSSVAGVVKEIKVKPGDKVDVGGVVLVVDEGGEAAKDEAPATAKRPEEAKAAPPSARAEAADRASAAGPGQESAPEEREEPQPARPADPKVVAMRPQPRGGEPAGGAAKPSRTETAAPRGARADAAAPRPAPAAAASPSVRRLAREVGVDVNEIQGTGPGGRISQEDVKEHARRIVSSIGSTRPAAAPAAAGRPLPDFTKWGEVERQPMSNIRRTTSRHLSHAWTTVPHVTQFDKADITALEALRRKYRDQVAKAGGNLTVTAILVKVLAAAVKQFPQFNASLDSDADEIVYKKYVNIGLAVDTDRGLLVPVIRDADKKNLMQIAIDVHQAAEKAHDRKLTLEEMSGGGMSISNLGGIGGTYFTPIVNWPEVAILGVSRGIVEPVWVQDAAGSATSAAPGGRFEPRQLLPLSLSYDHRVIDGADAMRFLRWVAEAIEQPFLLSLLA